MIILKLMHVVLWTSVSWSEHNQCLSSSLHILTHDTDVHYLNKPLDGHLVITAEAADSG